VVLRLFDFMAAVPSDEIIMFSKIDLSDGFWRMIVQDRAEWNFAYVLPDLSGIPTRLVVPIGTANGMDPKARPLKQPAETSCSQRRWYCTPAASESSTS
jgi:hypothetical protein